MSWYFDLTEVSEGAEWFAGADSDRICPGSVVLPGFLGEGGFIARVECIGLWWSGTGAGQSSFLS